MFVDYANVRDDWRREVSRISAALGTDLSAQDDNAINGFLKPTLRRQRYRGPAADPFGADWVPAVYDTLCAAPQDEAWDAAVLDGGAYQASERASGRP